MSSNISKKEIDFLEDPVDICVVHLPCKDGEACKYLLWKITNKMFGKELADKIIFFPYDYNKTNTVFDQVEKIAVGKNILFADCSFPEEQTNKIRELSNKCSVVNDKAECKEPASTQLFKLTFPGKNIPKAIKLIGQEDSGEPYKKDWDYLLEHEAFLFGFKFKSIPNLTNDDWDNYLEDETKVNSLIEASRKEINDFLPEVNKIVDTAEFFDQIINGKELKVAYIANTNFRIINLLGVYFLRQGNDLVSSYKYENEHFVHALRTRTGGDVDAAAIAKHVDSTGGGHFNAARCIVPTNRLPNDGEIVISISNDKC